MFIEEVLYQIDEDYRIYCDTIDLVCEEILLEDAKKDSDAWFFDMSPEKQQDYIKAHPTSAKTKELKRKLAKKKEEPTSKDAPKKQDSPEPKSKDKPEEPKEPKSDNKIGGELPDTVADLKQHVKGVRDALQVDIKHIATAFKQPSVYNTVKAIGGSLSATSNVVMGTLRTVGKSLTVAGAAIHDTKSFQKLEKGLVKTDEFMSRNKALATMSAVAVSGLAIGQWLRMSFSGDIESDFDLTIIPAAFAGTAGFADLIATPDGIKGMGLLSLGMATGGLPIWMGGPVGLAMALTYSGLKSAGETEAGQKVKQKMVDYAKQMGDTIGDAAKKVDKKLGLDKEPTPSMKDVKDTMWGKGKHSTKKPKYPNESVEESFSRTLVNKAIKLVKSPRHFQGDYTGAVKAIEKLKKGLSSDGRVKAALQTANEEWEKLLETPLVLPYIGDAEKHIADKVAEKFRKASWAQKVKIARQFGLKLSKRGKSLQIEKLLFIEAIQSIDSIVFADKDELKKPKYEEIDIFEDGWDTIKLDPPPMNSSGQTKKELTQAIDESNNASDEAKRQYINCDDDANYYIKEYMEDSDLEFDEDEVDYIKDQCKPIGRHYKNMYNRPRPYQLADEYKMELNKFKTGTANTPSYPSSHALQAYVVANFYAKKYPEHEGNLRDMADICAWGRVQAGLHYPSDYKAGVKLADEVSKYFKETIEEDAPVNSTGSAVSTDMPLVKRNKYQKKNKKDSQDIYQRILKRYD